MKINLILSSIILVLVVSCDPDPTGPESNCEIYQNYVLGYHGVDEAKVFDLRIDPPAEIKNGSIEYRLSSQLIFTHALNPTPYPYSEYFIDSVDFANTNMALISFYEQNTSRTYSFDSSDCQIDLTSTEGDLHLELTDGGQEISEQRFAIYEHKTQSSNLDTFLFLAFRLGAYSTYEEVIAQFARDNTGMYDTVAIELVQNRTQE
jgi:hypothetical protein